MRRGQFRDRRSWRMAGGACRPTPWSVGRGPLADQNGEETRRELPTGGGEILLRGEQHRQALEGVFFVLKGNEAVVIEDRSFPEAGLCNLETLAPRLKR